jgi:hypothetical protein
MNTLQNHSAARNPGGNVIPLRPGLSQSTPFDRLTATLVVAQYRAGTLPEAVLVALLAGAGLQQ